MPLADKPYKFGFTVVELLIVIVVIGVLAAVTVVAYSSISQQAATTALKSDLKNAKTKLELAKVTNGSYPSDDSGLTKSPGTNYQYTPTENGYCLSATSDRAGTSAFHVDETGTIQEGVCEGHTAPTDGGSVTQENQGVVTTLAGSTAGYVDGPGASAQFNAPQKLAVDTLGNIYVADAINNRIRKITSGGVVSTLAGSTYGYTDGPSTTARFNTPLGLDATSDATVFVADTSNRRVRKVTSTGDVTTFAGSGSTSGQYVDGPGDQANFLGMADLTVDSSGSIYVIDTSKIRKISSEGVVSTYSGSQVTGYRDRTSTGPVALFSNPTGIAVDSSGVIYVADTNNSRIRKIALDGSVSTLAGSTQGYVDGIGSAAKFNEPYDVAVSSTGIVYVADRGNNCIRKITPDGAVTTLAGSTVSGSNDGVGVEAQFNAPRGVAVDGNGVVYVSDRGNNRIRKIE